MPAGCAGEPTPPDPHDAPAGHSCHPNDPRWCPVSIDHPDTTQLSLFLSGATGSTSFCWEVGSWKKVKREPVIHISNYVTYLKSSRTNLHLNLQLPFFGKKNIQSNPVQSFWISSSKSFMACGRRVSAQTLRFSARPKAGPWPLPGPALPSRRMEAICSQVTKNLNEIPWFKQGGPRTPYYFRYPTKYISTSKNQTKSNKRCQNMPKWCQNGLPTFGPSHDPWLEKSHRAMGACPLTSQGGEPLAPVMPRESQRDTKPLGCNMACTARTKVARHIATWKHDLLQDNGHSNMNLKSDVSERKVQKNSNIVIWNDMLWTSDWFRLPMFFVSWDPSRHQHAAGRMGNQALSISRLRARQALHLLRGTLVIHLEVGIGLRLWPRSR